MTRPQARRFRGGGSVRWRCPSHHPAGHRDEDAPDAGPCFAGRDDRTARRARRCRGGRPRRLVAGRQLPDRRPDLPDGQPAAAGAADRRAHQAAAAGPLGDQPGVVLRLRARVPAGPRDRAGGALPGRTRPRRPRTGGRRLPRGDLHRDLPGGHPGHRGHAAALPAVLRTGRHPEPRVRDDSGLHPRGRGARLRAGARLRCGDGQPRPRRAGGGRRRRGRDRAPGGLVEGRLLPQPGARRGRAAGPAPQRRQDRRPHRAGPQGPRRGPLPARGPRVRRPRGRGFRPPRHAPPVRRGAGAGVVADPGHPGVRPRRRLGRHATAVADDRAPQPQGLDRTRRGGRRADAGHVPLPPGAAGDGPGEPGAPPDPRGVAAVLPPRGALRRRRRPDRGRAPRQPRRATCG